MNRKNWTGALLAVMMVISMMACFVLPAAAATDYNTLPLASTATQSDAYTEYRIDSVDELLRASHNACTTNPTANGSSNFKLGDVIYLTADLDIDAWDCSNWATYDAATGKYTTIGNWISNPNKTAYQVYSTTATGVELGSKKDVFAYLYNSFNARNAYYSYHLFNFNGLGHTIKNYYAYSSFLCGDTYGTISNLTFENARVENANPNKYTGWTGNAKAIVSRSCGENGFKVDNVHLINCTTQASSGTYHGAFLDLASNGARPVSITNSSMIGCNINAAAADSNNQFGLMIGDYRTTATLTLKNIVLYNCKISHPGKTDSYNNRGLLMGVASTKTPTLNVDNVAVINCTREFTENGAQLGVNAALVSALSLSVDSTLGTMYFMGNKVSYKDASGTPMTAPITTAIYTTGAAIAAQGMVNGTYITDNVEGSLAIDDDDSTDYAALLVKPGLTVEAIIAAINSKASADHKWVLEGSKILATKNPVGYSVIFKGDDFVTMLATDANGVPVVDADVINLLSPKVWVLQGTEGEIAEPWAKTVSENTVYVPAPHRNHIEAIPGDDANHRVVCDECSIADHNYTQACVDVTTEGVEVIDYFDPAVTKYTCACGNVWTIPLADAPAPEAPITVNYDADYYLGSNTAVKVALGAKADANLIAYTATVTFDPTKLVYEDYSTAFNCVVDDSNKANGVLTVAFVQAGGLVLNTEAMTLNFTTAEILTDTSTDVDVKVLSAVVLTDTGSVRKTPIITDVKVTTDLYYVPAGGAPEFNAGDVNNDTFVNLLDAVLVIQEINGSMHANQAANFQVWAADVDGDFIITSNDVTVLLKKSVGISVELIKATRRPVVVAP